MTDPDFTIEEDFPGDTAAEHPGTGTEPDAPLFSEIDLSNSFVEQHEQNLRYVSK